MFYDTYTELCNERNVAPSKVARELGMSASAPGRWKDGSTPDLVTAQKVADYFGVTIDYMVKGRPNTQTITAENSIILQGNRGNNNVTHTVAAADDLNDMEREMLRAFRALDMRRKNAALSHLYALEDELKGVSGDK